MTTPVSATRSLATEIRNGRDGAPIRLFLGGAMPDAETLAQLERLGSAPGVVSACVKLPWPAADPSPGRYGCTNASGRA